MKGVPVEFINNNIACSRCFRLLSIRACLNTSFSCVFFFLLNVFWSRLIHEGVERGVSALLASLLTWLLLFTLRLYISFLSFPLRPSGVLWHRLLLLD